MRIEVCRSRATLASILAALALCAPAVGQEPPKSEPPKSEPPKAGAIAVTLTGEFKLAEGASTCEVEGTADLPTNALVRAQLLFHGFVIQDVRAIVKESHFTLRFGPWKKVVLGGKYEVKIALPKELQHPTLRGQLAAITLSTDTATIRVGDANEEARTLERIKKKIFDAADFYRTAYLGMDSPGSFYRQELQHLIMSTVDTRIPDLKREQFKKDLAERRAAIIPAWRDFTRAYWDERFKTARFDWNLFKEQILASPYPEAEQHLEQLATAIETWYRSMSRLLYRLCEKEPPRDVMEGPAFDPAKLEAAVQDSAHATYKALGYEVFPQFMLNELSTPEEGLIHGDWFRSYVTKFAIRKPKDWDFKITGAGVKPSARIRILPPEANDPNAHNEVLMMVEIVDFYTAKDHKHLALLARDANRARFANGKEIYAKDMKATDPTMPGGERPGLDTEFTYNGGGRTLHGRIYQLFCRWHKRTYGVLCLCPEGRWEELKPTFAKSLATFRVLDAPEYEPIREQEKRQKLKDEHRDPDAVLKKAKDYEMGEDEAGGGEGKKDDHKPGGESSPSPSPGAEKGQ